MSGPWSEPTEIFEFQGISNILDVSTIQNFSRIFCDGWIELFELYKKKYISNFTNISDGSQNFGSISLILTNKSSLDFFRKIRF